MPIPDMFGTGKTPRENIVNPVVKVPTLNAHLRMNWPAIMESRVQDEFLSARARSSSPRCRTRISFQTARRALQSSSLLRFYTQWIHHWQKWYTNSGQNLVFRHCQTTEVLEKKWFWKCLPMWHRCFESCPRPSTVLQTLCLRLPSTFILTNCNLRTAEFA